MTPFQTITNDSIDAQAATWFARNRNQPDRHCREQFNAWKAIPAHARAYAEFESLWAELGELQPRSKPAPCRCAGVRLLPWQRQQRCYAPCLH
jgi:hypothetical protein